MKKRTFGELIQGIDSLLIKNRASLTVEEVELIEEIKLLLFELDTIKEKQLQKTILLKIVLKLSSIFLSNHTFEKLDEFVNQLFNCL